MNIIKATTVADCGVGVSQHRNPLKWIIYISLLLFRFIGVFQRGYIHPDEFFQGGQELFFGIDGRNAKLVVDLDGADDEYIVRNIPWEFEPKHAVRSIVPPFFMTLLPLRLYVILRDTYLMGIHDDANIMSTVDEELNDVTSLRKSWRDSYNMAPDTMNLSGREILLVPRLFIALLSVVFLDGSLWILTNLNRHRSDEKLQGRVWISIGPPIEVIVIASSWPCLAFGVRPFTNSLEAMVLAFLLVIVAMHETKNDDPQHIPHSVGKRKIGITMLAHGDIPWLLLIGAACSVGVFVRFTFIFFAFPVVALFLWKKWRRWEYFADKLINAVHDGTWLALSFLLVSCAFIVVDAQYYSQRAVTACAKLGCWTNFIAPFNAFRYNSNRSNLAQHGLHPRVTHLAVNLPILFGPLAFLGYGSTIRYICGGTVTTNGTGCPVARATCHWTIVSGLILLSCAPHQEPRFLLPLIVPLVYLYGRDVIGRSRSLLALWIVFNLACYIFFGWLHQGGLLQSLLNTDDLIGVRNEIASRHHPLRVFIYYKTYMPPTFLARRKLQQIRRMEEACEVETIAKACMRDLGEDLILLDLKGADSTVLLTVLRKWRLCPSQELGSTVVNVITPQAALLPLVERPNESVMLDEYAIIPTWNYQGHISTEDWGVKLGIYIVFCTS